MKFRYDSVNAKPFIPGHIIGLYQEGGELVEGEPMPTEAEQDPFAQLVMMAEEALASENPEIAMQVCSMILQLAQGGAPGEEMPAEGEEPMPEGMPEGEPMPE